MNGHAKNGVLAGPAYVVVKGTILGLVGTYLYKHGLWSNWFFLIIPVIALMVLLLQKKKKSEMAFRVFFVKAIKKYFPNESSVMVAEVDQRYEFISKDTWFAATSSNPIDKRLNFTAYFLALIQVLESRNQSYEQIKKICLEITYDYVSPKNSFQKWLKKLPAKLVGLKIVTPLLKAFHKKISSKGNPDGFLAEVITDKAQTYGLGYGFDILECGICKLFQKHHAGKYATILCEVDKVTSNLAGLELIRKSTIAYGAETCDFRFKRISNKKSAHS